MTLVEATEIPRSSAVVPFMAGMVMSAAEAKAQVELIREIQRSVMTEGTDYGIVPGTERPALFKSGAELLLRVHGFGHRCDRIEVERDEHGRKFGVTYQCTVTQGPRDHEVVIATCDGYCGYDESKYFQSTTMLETRERANAARYQRPARPEKWAEEYRSPWNTLVKMAIKRALVGASLQATAASGLFTQDLEDQHDPASAPPPAPQWQVLGYADPDEMSALKASLLDMMNLVPKDQADGIGAVFDRLGYPKGSRLPVAKEHVPTIREALRAVLRGADAETGEVPPEGPGGAVAGQEDDERPFDDDRPADSPEPVGGWRDDLDEVYLTEDALGNRGRLDLLEELVGTLDTAGLAEAWARRGQDPFDSIETIRAGLVEWVISAHTPATSVPDHKQPPADDPNAPEGQQTLDPPERKPRSKASGVHAQLAVLGVTKKPDQEACILVATAGRTSHTSEMSETEIAVAYGLARQVQEGQMLLDEIRAQATKFDA